MAASDKSGETVTFTIAGGTIDLLKSSIEEAVQPQEEDMPVTLDEAKVYLRVDGTEDDEIISACLEKARALCQAVSRLDDEAFSKAENTASVKIAVLYALGYLYQNREGANHLELAKTLRALLMDVREEVF